LSIKKKPSDYARPLLVVVILFAVGLGLLTCVVGGVVLGVIAANNESTAAKLPGSWTGQFNILGQQVNTVYTFKKDGTFREESVDGLGNRQVADGRWRVKNGEVHIDWNQGGFEVATVHFLNQNTMDYRIINHNQLAQIGIGTTFKRR
jgi:hypothetical protein